MKTLASFDVRTFFRSPLGLAVITGGVVVGYFLLRSSQVNFVTILPFLLIGGCLLMHLFMPHGHGHQGDDRSNHERNRDGSDNNRVGFDDVHSDSGEVRQGTTRQRRIP